METINVNDIPSAAGAKAVQTKEVELKNVILKNGKTKDMSVKVVPFDRSNNTHVGFAFAYSDMIYRMPSDFKNVSEAAQAYCAIFMVHKTEDETNENSDFNTVLNDLRAARTLFHQPEIQKELNDFFANA